MVTQSGSDLDASLTPPSNLPAGFKEAPTPYEPVDYKNAYPDDPWDMPQNSIPEEKDWVGARTRAVAGVSDKLEQLLFERIRMPVYDASGRYGTGASDTAFH